MKKLLLGLLCAGSMALSACSATIYKAADSATKLEEKGYKTEMYTLEESKALISGLNYEGASFTVAVYATKGEEKDKDLFLGFYFKTTKEAEDFLAKDDNSNLALMNKYGEDNLGENLKLKVGSHNNIAFVGSETSFANAGLPNN